MTTPRLPREDLVAAMATREELGPDYDDAIIDSFVTRIQETLDARLATQRPAPAAPRRPGPDRGQGLALAIVSLVAAIPLSAIGVVNAELPGLLIVWAGIVLVNLAYALRTRSG